MNNRQDGTDPNRLLSLTSLFDDLQEAQRAAKRLEAAGIAQSSISLITAEKTLREMDQENAGLWSKPEDFLFPEKDNAEYNEGIRRGGHVLTVSRLSVEHYDQAFEILNDAGAVDLDARTESWRSGGWNDGQRLFKEPKDTPTIVDGDVAASLIDSRRGDEIVSVITEKLPVGQRSDRSRSRVRVYTVEYALKDTTGASDNPSQSEPAELPGKPASATTGTDE